MIVGGREFGWSREDVKRTMRGVEPESIREHVVEVLDEQYPPKQVLATVTGWERQTFTTMEAQRVLTKLGFPCHRAGVRYSRDTAWVDVEQRQPGTSDEQRITALEAALATAQEAIASLRRRMEFLESAR
jgi:hypothetical protein